MERSVGYAIKLFDLRYVESMQIAEVILTRLSPDSSLECFKQLFSKMNMEISNKAFLEETFVIIARLLSSPRLHSPHCIDFLYDVANRMVEESRLQLSAVVSEATLIVRLSSDLSCGSKLTPSRYYGGRSNCSTPKEISLQSSDGVSSVSIQCSSQWPPLTALKFSGR